MSTVDLSTPNGDAIPIEERSPDDLERELFLKVGDRVEVSSPGIGTLRNPLVRDGM